MTKGRILLGRILFSLSKQLIALAASLVVGRQALASVLCGSAMALSADFWLVSSLPRVPFSVSRILRSVGFNLARYLANEREVYLLLESIY